MSKTVILPFETWRPIFQSIYSSPERNSISHPPSQAEFELSPLHVRVNIYRALAAVSHSWKRNAKDVFFEELQALTVESLMGIISSATKERGLGRAVRKIEFSFWEFRCSASAPRRPRQMVAHREAVGEARDNGERDDEDATFAFGRELFGGRWNYRPSQTKQGEHWQKWHGLCATLLHQCPSLAQVKVNFTSDHEHRSTQRSGKNYPTLFPQPDLRIDSIFRNLLACSNLRHLELVDPSPLAEYGPNLYRWERLQRFAICITSKFPEIEELGATPFNPPRSLQHFKIVDNDQGGKANWPTSGDLLSCTNLKKLEIGVHASPNTAKTRETVSYLIRTYTETLEFLSIDFLSHSESNADWLDIIFASSDPPLRFPSLNSLRLLSTRVPSDIFQNFTSPNLASLTFHSLASEADWTRVQVLGRYKSLRNVKEMRILSRVRDREALEAACKNAEVELIVGN